MQKQAGMRRIVWELPLRFFEEKSIRCSINDRHPSNVGLPLCETMICMYASQSFRATMGDFFFFPSHLIIQRASEIPLQMRPRSHLVKMSNLLAS